VTVPDTYAESHIGSTATKPGAAAQKTAQNNIDKYFKLASAHIFYPFAIETAGTRHEMVIELTQEIGRRITTITEDTRETTFLFQRLSMALQRRRYVYGYATPPALFIINVSQCHPGPDLAGGRPGAQLDCGSLYRWQTVKVKCRSSN